ncbi:hypothetical protein [Janibacter sp. Soil728]|nr:hypothetical protein [Janibacter sp. Soil728]
MPLWEGRLDVTMRVLERLAADDGVSLRLSTVSRRECPWVDLTG